jgi:hypothetical protein
MDPKTADVDDDGCNEPTEDPTEDEGMGDDLEYSGSSLDSIVRHRVSFIVKY